MKPQTPRKSSIEQLPHRILPLWNAFARGVRDNLLGEFAVQALRISGMVFLARELAPADFGLLKVLLIVSMFGSLACEFGIPDALIQRKDLTREHETTAWWVILGLAAITTIALYYAAPIIADVMAIKGLRFAIRVICLPFFLEGTALVSVARLSRSLQFSVLAMADVAAEIAFLVGAFGLIWYGRPEWSLGCGLAARLTVHASVIWIVDRHLPLGKPRVAAIRDLRRFAASVLGGRIITTASGNADFLLVGRLLGGSALGYYSMAWDLLRFVPDRLHRVVGRVALPTFCRLQDDNQDLAEAYRAFLNYVARIVLPIAGCVAVAATELLVGLYGRQWLPAVVPLRLLAFGLALIGLRIGIGAVYYARGYPSIDIYLNGARLILIVTAVVATARIGLAGVSLSVSLVEAAISIIGQYVVCALTDLRLRDVAASTIPGLRIAAACMLATAVGKALAIWGQAHGPFALAFTIIPPALVFFCFEGREFVQMAVTSFRPVTVPQID